MTILSINRLCDVCGKPITQQQDFIEFITHLGILFDPSDPCHCHTGKCEEAFRAAQKTEDWKLLPPGPLRMFFEQYTQTRR